MPRASSAACTLSKLPLRCSGMPSDASKRLTVATPTSALDASSLTVRLSRSLAALICDADTLDITPHYDTISITMNKHNCYLNHTIIQLMLKCQGAYAPKTLKSYAADLRGFGIWCLDRGLCWFPADGEVIARYIDEACAAFVMSTATGCSFRVVSRTSRGGAGLYDFPRIPGLRWVTGSTHPV